MKAKHVRVRIAQCLALAEASECPRRRLAALLVEPLRNVVIADGYNGGDRGGPRLCGGEVCERDRLGIASGDRLEVGCHHAEANAVCNAAASGASTLGAWLFVTGEPCLACARLLGQAGVARVVCVRGGYLAASTDPEGGDGVRNLRRVGVGVDLVDGPADPRTAATTTEPPRRPVGTDNCRRFVPFGDVSRRPADPDCDPSYVVARCFECARRSRTSEPRRSTSGAVPGYDPASRSDRRGGS